MSLEPQRGLLSETHLTDGAEIRPNTATPGNRDHLKRSTREARPIIRTSGQLGGGAGGGFLNNCGF